MGGNKLVFLFCFVEVQDDHIWEVFEDCGAVENIRLIRDEKTGVGKGFGYVNFKVKIEKGYCKAHTSIYNSYYAHTYEVTFVQTQRCPNVCLSGVSSSFLWIIRNSQQDVSMLNIVCLHF